MTKGNDRLSRAGGLIKEIVADRRLALMLALGFSAGLPFLLVFSTLSAWLRESGIARTEIGFLSYVALAYSFKFLWAPVIDRRDVPLLWRFGRRRAWMLLAQAGVAIGLIGIAFGNPSQSLVWTVACAFFVAFSSATQDVVVDGWRIGAAPIERQGMMSASYQLGYRIALSVRGRGRALYRRLRRLESGLHHHGGAHGRRHLGKPARAASARNEKRGARANPSSSFMPSRSPSCFAGMGR